MATSAWPVRSLSLSLAAGMGLLQRQAELPTLPALVFIGAGAAAMALLALRASDLPRCRWMMSLAASALLGFAWASIAAQWRLADALDPSMEGRDVMITGVIASLPQPVERGVRFDFDVDRDPAPGVPGRVLLAWYNGLTPEETQAVSPVRAGERWRFVVRLRRPHGLANPHGFDYEGFLLERGLRATGYVRSAVERVDDFVPGPAYIIERWRERLRERFWDALPAEREAGILVALAIGEQRAIDASDWQTFARTGVSHLMSISGLHVTMVAGVLAALVFAAWRRTARLALRLPAQKAAAVAGFAGALLYCVVSGFAVPAQRTLYMVGVVALALWLDRATSASRVLAIALAIVLLFDPWAVLEAGFWLSFGAVALIFYTCAARPERGWLLQWGAVQGAMTLGLAPLTVALFQQVSLVAPLANAFAIPVVSFVVTPLALLGMLLPFDAPLHLAVFVLHYTMVGLEALATLPGAVWQQHAPAAWTIALALAGTGWVLAPRGFPARSAGLVMMAPMFTVLPPGPEPGTARVTVLDVGQGMAVVVRTAHHAVVYDAGPAWGDEAGADGGARVIVPYLRAEGIGSADALIVSHDDTDHSGGARSILSELTPGWLLSSLSGSHPLVALAPLHAECVAGLEWTWDGVRFSVLHPTRRWYLNPYVTTNDRSCVLAVETQGASVLLAGDISRLAEEDLLARSQLSKTEVLLVPHHGSATSSSERFVEAVSPRYAVFSVGYRNRFGHPRADVVERYATQGAELARTDSGGAWIFAMGAAGVTGEGWRQTRRRYWQGL